MSDELRQQIYRKLNQKDSDELIKIWQANNRAEWTDMTFDLIHEILQERHVELPPQNEPSFEPEKKLPENDVASMNLLQTWFSFDGRIGVGTFWLKGILPLMVISILARIVVESTDNVLLLFVALLISLATIWVSLAVAVKRWHDRDKSGIWILIGLIPIIGQLWVFIETGFLPGTNGPNQYGSRSF